MSIWIYTLLFISGSAIGSFLNVLTLRYDPENAGLFEDVYGRSHCPYCKRELRPYELVPVLSFLIQMGRCRSCGHRLSLQYPIVEILSGLTFVLVPYALMPWHPLYPTPYFLIGVWILAILAFITLSIIDLRFQIIPDGINIFIAFLGLASLAYEITKGYLFFKSSPQTSFLGSYASMFPVSGTFWINIVIGALFSFCFFGALYVLSRGRGIGLGDVKLAAAAGLLMGWPDISIAIILAFVIGAFFSVVLMIRKKKGIKDHIPFGPFIVLGVTLVFFLGYHILNAYFSAFSLI